LGAGGLAANPLRLDGRQHLTSAHPRAAVDTHAGDRAGYLSLHRHDIHGVQVPGHNESAADLHRLRGGQILRREHERRGLGGIGVRLLAPAAASGEESSSSSNDGACRFGHGGL
jgi:hypothetical protein